MNSSFTVLQKTKIQSYANIRENYTLTDFANIPERHKTRWLWVSSGFISWERFLLYGYLEGYAIIDTDYIMNIYNYVNYFISYVEAQVLNILLR